MGPLQERREEPVREEGPGRRSRRRVSEGRTGEKGLKKDGGMHKWRMRMRGGEGRKKNQAEIGWKRMHGARSDEANKVKE